MITVKSLQQLQRQINFTDMDFLSMASTPTEEKCTQAGVHAAKAMIECTAFINQLIRVHGTPPAHTELIIIENYHDTAGVYYEAAVLYNNNDSAEENPSLDYALLMESELPQVWDAEAIKELQGAGYFVTPVPAGKAQIIDINSRHSRRKTN